MTVVEAMRLTAIGLWLLTAMTVSFEVSRLWPGLLSFVALMVYLTSVVMERKR